MADKTFAGCLKSFNDLPKPLAMYCAHVARNYRPGRRPAVPPFLYDPPLVYTNTVRANWAGPGGTPEPMRYDEWPYQF